MLTIKWFNGIKSRFKGFIMQIKLKLQRKGHKIATLSDVVVYIRLFLLKKVLKWVKLYLTKYQDHGLTTNNKKVQYMFLS